MNDFYRFIYPEHNGYVIRKNNQYYGWYDDIRLALYERDRLEFVEWDIGEWVYLPDTYNKYDDCVLPPRGLKRWRQYIYYTGNGWRIQKKVDGELKHFGYFDNLNDAIQHRDELILKDWIL